MKQEKDDRSKNGRQTDCGFPSSGWVAEFKFAANAQLLCSAILLLLSD